jgi:hypothetical protein
MPVHEEGKPNPSGLQLWIDLPKQVRSCSCLVDVRLSQELVQDDRKYSLVTKVTYTHLRYE